jgi:hypothetical protein
VSTAPPPAPATLAEFLEQYTPKRVLGRVVPAQAARFAAEWVTAADAGTEPPPMEDLDGDSLWAVGEILDVLLQHNREYSRITALLFQLIREYRKRVEIVPGAAGGPGQLLRLPPTARLRSRLGPVFRPSRDVMVQPPAVVGHQLLELAASTEAAAQFLRSLGRAVDTGVPGDAPGADTTALDEGGIEAVTALLSATARTLQAQGHPAAATDRQLLAKAWDAWRAER